MNILKINKVMASLNQSPKFQSAEVWGSDYTQQEELMSK